ncbi:MAG: hypothetical protein LUQ31_07075 [Methanoregula sp.]|nr:hypothetical protein [Methanoregula sp.]
MDPQEHIHIISAGEKIHEAYPAAIRDLRTITHTFVFAEKEVYTNSARDDTKKRMWKCAIRDAIDAVNSISRSKNISCALVCIDAATFDAIRDPVLGIFGNHPDARYSFDISAGSKRLSLGLFSMSLWVEGDAWYAFGNSPIRRVPVPAFPVKNLAVNPYYLVILTILFRGQENGKQTRTLMPKETLFNETKTWQIPAYDYCPGTDRPELSLTEFSGLLSTLTGWNLIREESDPGNDPEKLYHITPDGELAIYVYLARLKKRGFGSAPGLT